MLSVGVAGSASLEQATAWRDSFNLTYPVFYDPGNQVFAQFEGLAIPLNVIIDQEQRLAYRRNGFHPASIHHMLDSLLGLDTSVDVRPLPVPLRSDLLRSYPNPFNQATTIEFTVNRAGPVTLNVFDVLGRRVAELLNKSMTLGSYSAHWNGRAEDGVALPSGPYWIQMRAAGSTANFKVILSR